MSVVEPLKDVLNAGRRLDPAAVGSQVVLMSSISVVTVLAFNVLRPKNKIIYEPKVKYHEDSKAPPRISDSLFGWLPPLINTREPELLGKIGLDAVAFLRFLRLMRWLFFGTAVLTCGILVPINVMYNGEHPAKYHDVLSVTTIRDVKGPILYAHVAVTYLITILLVVLVYVHWRSMVRLRHQWFRSPEYIQAFYARTVSIMHLPKRFRTDEGLREFLDGLKMPYPVTSLHIGRKVGRLPELIEYHNQTVREFEAVLVRYLRGGKIGKRRPAIRVGGFCGCGGVKKDAIEFYTAKLSRTEAAIEEYRAQIDTRRPESFGFASLAAVPYAHIVAKKLHDKHPKGTVVTLAPNPKDIIWTNMSKSHGVLLHKKVMGFLWLGLICLLSLIPLFPVATLANLDAITATGYLPFLQIWSDRSPITYAIVSGVLPPAVAGLFTFFLPKIMRWLSNYMGALTRARLDRAVIARYFAFLIISQLIIFTLLGVLFNSVVEVVTLIGMHASAKTIIANLNKLPATINKTYVNQASYWLKWFPMRGFLVIFDLAQILNLLWISFKTRVFGRTPRDIREWTQPPSFEYAIYYSNLLFMGAVGLLFAPLAPLVSLAACIVFWLSSWVYKYQLMFVFVTKVETGGRLWNVIINRLLFSAMLMQALMVLTVGLQYKFRSLQWLCTIPPLVIIIIFKIFLHFKFDKEFRYYIPSEEELRHAKVHSERADHRGHRLENRFGHPALHEKLFTPLVHAKMMPLLAEVYKGKIEHEKVRGVLHERSGKKLDVNIIEGVRIAAIEQNDLEYDPILYQRDRGELDWDTQSVSSAVLLSPSSIHSGSMAAGIDPGWSNPEYQNYLAHGPNSPIALGTLLELRADQRPLLRAQHGYRQGSGYLGQQTHHPSTSMYSSTASDTSQQRSQVLSWYPYSDQHTPTTPANPAEYPPQQFYPPQHYSSFPMSLPASPEAYTQQRPPRTHHPPAQFQPPPR
ncbi:putative cytosolic domain of 10TM putative phosphate transporter [Lyophyllum shimeji]|uniref:Cytosolic domain of 10TM putative phosphate transporter n=1 Tax=Lyophyllum shimeji TaxID=47721 RepID=A0A9P3PK71_LYOSH|nr:putative cytosolic domain of 10TM putative phosphate transporter [Lyophyllum shimeji]